MPSVVVKTHQPWKTRLLMVLGLLALVFGGLGVFEYGRYSAGFDTYEAKKDRQALEDKNEQLHDAIASLREEKAFLERAAQIDKQAYKEQKDRLRGLQAEILELKEELAFYRGIVSPRDASRGLRLQSFKVESNGTPRGFRYKVVLTQVLKNDRTASGTVNLEVEGMHKNDPKTYQLRDLTENSIKELEYRFRYFQNIEGDLVLPKEFKPLRITVAIHPRGRHQDEIEKTIDWPS
jgi:hypothetical protein